jgi:hypothetical protein
MRLCQGIQAQVDRLCETSSLQAQCRSSTTVEGHKPGRQQRPHLRCALHQRPAAAAGRILVGGDLRHELRHAGLRRGAGQQAARGVLLRAAPPAAADDGHMRVLRGPPDGNNLAMVQKQTDNNGEPNYVLTCSRAAAPRGAGSRQRRLLQPPLGRPLGYRCRTRGRITLVKQPCRHRRYLGPALQQQD